VNYIAQKYECEPTLDAVVAVAIMTKTPQDLKSYTKMLYDEENVIGSVPTLSFPIGIPIRSAFV
jgi:hypothetical protein